MLVVEIARNQAELYGATEDFLVTREFARTASQEDRERLLRAAFAIGAADQTITSMESAELNEIGKELGFADAEVDAIRNEYRDSLSVVQAMRQMTVANARRHPSSKGRGSRRRLPDSPGRPRQPARGPTPGRSPLPAWPARDARPAWSQAA